MPRRRVRICILYFNKLAIFWAAVFVIKKCVCVCLWFVNRSSFFGCAFVFWNNGGCLRPGKGLSRVLELSTK